MPCHHWTPAQVSSRRGNMPEFTPATQECRPSYSRTNLPSSTMHGQIRENLLSLKLQKNSSSKSTEEKFFLQLLRGRQVESAQVDTPINTGSLYDLMPHQSKYK